MCENEWDNDNLHNWQRAPVNPGLQVQKKLFPFVVHVPPLRQGADEHVTENMKLKIVDDFKYVTL